MEIKSKFSKGLMQAKQAHYFRHSVQTRFPFQKTILIIFPTDIFC